MQNYTFRLTLGQDSFDSIQAFVMENTFRQVASSRRIPLRDGVSGVGKSGCKIYTTAEIVLIVFDDIIYKRELPKIPATKNWQSISQEQPARIIKNESLQCT